MRNTAKCEHEGCKRVARYKVCHTEPNWFLDKFTNGKFRQIDEFDGGYDVIEQLRCKQHLIEDFGFMAHAVEEE